MHSLFEFNKAKYTGRIQNDAGRTAVQGSAMQCKVKLSCSATTAWTTMYNCMKIQFDKIEKSCTMFSLKFLTTKHISLELNRSQFRSDDAGAENVNVNNWTHSTFSMLCGHYSLSSAVQLTAHNTAHNTHTHVISLLCLPVVSVCGDSSSVLVNLIIRNFLVLPLRSPCIWLCTIFVLCSLPGSFTNLNWPPLCVVQPKRTHQNVNMDFMCVRILYKHLGNTLLYVCTCAHLPLLCRVANDHFCKTRMKIQKLRETPFLSIEFTLCSFPFSNLDTSHQNTLHLHTKHTKSTIKVMPTIIMHSQSLAVIYWIEFDLTRN